MPTRRVASSPRISLARWRASRLLRNFFSASSLKPAAFSRSPSCCRLACCARSIRRSRSAASAFSGTSSCERRTRARASSNASARINFCASESSASICARRFSCRMPSSASSIAFRIAVSSPSSSLARRKATRLSRKLLSARSLSAVDLSPSPCSRFAWRTLSASRSDTACRSSSTASGRLGSSSRISSDCRIAASKFPADSARRADSRSCVTPARLRSSIRCRVCVSALTSSSSGPRSRKASLSCSSASSSRPSVIRTWPDFSSSRPRI